ncbi:MAG: hypothetical protein HY275_16685 [Gemmatimonadetes bacterium]|nr:hypothetical protein [Gemmatimonadota bacterium]
MYPSPGRRAGLLHPWHRRHGGHPALLRRRAWWRLWTAALAFACGTGVAAAQHAHGQADTTRQEPEGSAAVQAAMGVNITPGAHLVLTGARIPTAADSARALAVADTLRGAIARFRDTALALREGFRPFAPNVKGQKVLHYTRWAAALKEAFRFDPAQPTSLLYVREGDGRLTLVGAMYTAPRRVSETALDQRLPLSIVRWHRHVKLCLPPKGEEARLAERRDGQPLFGPDGMIDDEAGCTAVRGRWFANLFGWMVHANVYAGRDLASIYGEGEHHH